MNNKNVEVVNTDQTVETLGSPSPHVVRGQEHIDVLFDLHPLQHIGGATVQPTACHAIAEGRVET